MRLFVLILAASVFFAGKVASGEVFTGQRLRDLCGHDLRGVRESRRFTNGICVGFVEGVRAIWDGMFFCVPENEPSWKLVAAANVFLEMESEEKIVHAYQSLATNASVHVVVALRARYPCKRNVEFDKKFKKFLERENLRMRLRDSERFERFLERRSRELKRRGR